MRRVCIYAPHQTGEGAAAAVLLVFGEATLSEGI